MPTQPRDACRRGRVAHEQQVSSAPPANRLVIGLAQIDCTVGDIAGNLARLRAARAEAAGFGADLVMFSELFIAGYPPEDLVFDPPSKRWTPLISSFGSRKVFVWYSASSIHG